MVQHSTVNVVVYGIIHQLTFKQNSNNWIERGFKTRFNGRQSILDFYQHYDGGNEKHKRLKTSRAEMKLLTYKNKHVMTFRLYSSKLKKCFYVIEKCDPPGVSNSTQINIMLSAINTSSVCCSAP